MVVVAVRRLLEIPQFPGPQVAAEEVLGEGVQDVDAVDSIVLADRHIENHQTQEVRLRDAKRFLQRVDELAQIVEMDVLRRLFVVTLPDLNSYCTGF